MQIRLEECSLLIQPLTSIDRRNLTKTGRWYSEKEEAIDVKTHSEEERGRKKGELGGSCNGRDCWRGYRTTLTGRAEGGLKRMKLPQF